MRYIKRNLGMFYETAITYPAPITLNYNYNFGIYALIVLGLQIVTGIFLVMFYCSNSTLAFLSVEHIMRDVPYGWFIRYLHANGASFFFIVVYAHLIRGLFYGSYFYPRRLLWCSGVIILLLMILTSFLGYVLPWGQMSYWAATVITNLASTVPFFGPSIVKWLWSGFSVDNPTLSKFFALHYLFPFIILGLVLLHLALLHKGGSSNPLGIKRSIDEIPFHPYYTIKDGYSVILFIAIIIFFVAFIPNTLGHPDNYIPANPEQTPEHIVPEWYFLPFYAILRSIPDKLLGVIALVASIITLLILPFIDRPLLRSSIFKPFVSKLNILFVANCVVLGYIGQSPLEEPFLSLGKISTIFFFAYFILIKLAGFLDKFILQYLKNSNKNILISKIPLIFLGITPDTSVFLNILVVFLFFFLILTKIWKKYFKEITKAPMIFSFVIIVSLSMMSVKFPVFSYALAVVSLFSLLFLSLPSYSIFQSIKNRQNIILDKLINKMFTMGLLHIFHLVYLNIWCLSSIIFKKLFIFLFFLNISYLLASRYYFMHMVFYSTIGEEPFSNLQLNLFNIMFFLGILSIYLRVFLNLSFLVTSYSLSYKRNLISHDCVLLMDPIDPPVESAPKVPVSGSTPNYGTQFIFFQRNHNNVRNVMPNVGLARKFGVVSAICSMCVLGGTLYYSRMQGLETMRQNDLKEVELNLRTIEDYMKKWGYK